ncbi:MAG: hypothetical protein FWC20_11795, partial [Oscillospiraceae bacterium]|nr:hypothetical protein [Oscillospiraceae bacterium]
KHSNATGFAYLNAIFFDRHNKYFKKKLVTRCSIMLFLPVLVVGVILIVSLTQGVVFDGGILRDQLGLEVYQLHYLFSYVPVFFYLIYLVSMGRIITASVFSNCDIQMLHYSYYRTRDNIFASFKSRITVILKYNLLITTVMSASVIFIVSLIFGHLDILYSGILFVVLTTIGVLFAFNDLFLYYVIQPYDEAGKAKSTVYTIINSVIVIIAVINLQNRFDFFVYSAVAIGATVVYIGLGLVLLLMFAPKRFKLR